MKEQKPSEPQITVIEMVAWGLWGLVVVVRPLLSLGWKETCSILINVAAIAFYLGLLGLLIARVR